MSEKTRSLIQNFVDVYNGTADASVYYLYAPEVDWHEFPTARSGGRNDLFAALREAREQVSDLQLEVVSIVADEDSGVLESRVTGKHRATGADIVGIVLWFFTFRDGLICKETEYAVQVLDTEAAAKAAASVSDLWNN